MHKTSLFSSSILDMRLFRINPFGWLLLLIISVVAAFLFNEGIGATIASWSREEYSHGYLLPAIAGFFIWQKRNDLAQLPNDGSWLGFVVVLFGVLMLFAGELGTLYIIEQYAVVVTLYGVALAFLGWPRFRLVFPALLLLLFTVPLPSFLYNNLSQSLQLLSSEIGVQVIRLFGVSVFLEGNVIDLGDFKLQVVEACSGLRYLFPLMALGYIAAYMFKGAWWKRALIFLSTIPVTVLMNSFRIGVIGVLVDRWGQAMAEGFLHDFEGWIIFMACAAVLMVEMGLLARIGPNKMALAEAFGMEAPTPLPEGAKVYWQPVPKPLWASLGVMVVALGVSQLVSQRQEVLPEVKSFASFPMQVGNWQGKPDRLDQIYVDALKFSDYMIGDYVDGRGVPVNLYIAWYASQRKGASVHSPRSCIPGGGWEIKSLSQRLIEGVKVAGRPLVVNRTVIQMGDVKQLVYYWFQQRGRVMTNEYLVKWFLFWDAVTRNRTDGSLVRLTATVRPGQEVEEVDGMLADFSREVAPVLDEFIPQ